MTANKLQLLICLFLLPTVLWQTEAQSLPLEMHLSADSLRLITGNNPTTGLYDEAIINTFELQFSQPNYWNLLLANYASSTDLPATLTINGYTLPNPVGVRFKGQTSYSNTMSSQKKSFNISLDYVNQDQEYEGYKTFNLNNCFDDPSFVREVLYYHFNRRHIPCAKANYVQLFINGESWGVYPSIQQLNMDFYDEWFMSRNGTNWRALKTTGTGGGGPGGGGGFGAGYCSLNWLGWDTTVYKGYYILKSAHKEDPWVDLVNTCYELNNPPLATLPETLKDWLDIDRALWFLAHEIIFSDDDGYAHKGGMDYYVYYEPETGRIVPQEYDGNTCMKANNANWSPFYHANDANFALLNRLLAVPELRQRYLAHVRTIINQSLEQTQANTRIDYYYSLISTLVQNDTKKLYTFTAFNNEKNVLKNFIQTRRTNLNANSEVNVTGLTIGEVIYYSNNTPFLAPDAGQPVNVTAAISGTTGVYKIWLYYASDNVGSFDRIDMFDDGLHNDGNAGDGIFGQTIPGFPNGTRVRYYIEAIANNTPKTATYKPEGAEHDVFTYRVNISEFVPTPVVINELMASNSNTMADEFGTYDDWIELYNNSSSSMDLSGWHLTDNPENITKWTFPTGSVIAPNNYMIVWADEEGGQGNYHANFKLSQAGEMLYLVQPDLSIADEVVFGAQLTDMGYARVPNGLGDFVIQQPTFNASNNFETSTLPDVVINEVMASNTVTITDEFGDFEDWIELYNNSNTSKDLSGWYLTDAANNLTKWIFPAGSVIPPNSYMIIWADDEAIEGAYHAAFKLSASGELVYLVRPDLTISDGVVFGAQQADLGYARVPNGTGNFVIQEPTFNANNDLEGPNSPGVRVKAKVMLEGAYNFLTGNMTTYLFTNGLIPVNQPYNSAPFNYSGTESVASIPANVVDWVLLSVTSQSDGTVYRKAAFLRNDGILIDLDGSEGVVFPSGLVEGNSYLIAVSHRNHFKVIAKTTIILPNASAYDLTSESNIEPACVTQVAAGLFAMVAGNCQNDRAINYSDFNILNNQVGQNNYNIADLNLNAVINTIDFNLFRVNAGRINFVSE
ncbi:MAG: CotH kinase family protein [Sphingobacteriales bacterium]|nr:MAG: CotH kinase family protein [Sphingobacteriales bacterium]